MEPFRRMVSLGLSRRLLYVPRPEICVGHSTTLTASVDHSGHRNLPSERLTMDAPTDNRVKKRKRRACPLRLIIFGTASVSSIYFWMQGDTTTAGAVAFLGLGLRGGYRAGVGAFLGLFAGGALAMFAAVPVGKAFEPVFQHEFGTQGLSNRLLSVGTVGAIMTLIMAIFVWRVVHYLVRKQSRLQTYNRWLGMACGGIYACLMILVVAGGVIVIEPLARDELSTDRTENCNSLQHESERIVLAAKFIRSSTIGPIVTACNPFEHIGPLKCLQHGVALVRSPDSLNAVAYHPEVEALYERPVVRRTMEQLSADPQLRGFLSYGDPMTHETLSALMENPAILRLFDDREFVRRLTRALSEIEPQTRSSSTSW